MKQAVLFFGLIILSIQSGAVVTKHCQESLELKVDEIQVFSKDFVGMQIGDIVNLHENAVFDDDANGYFLEGNMSSINLNLVLENTKNSVCRYKEEGVVNSRYDIRISGTDKEPVLVIDHFQNDVFYKGVRTDVSYIMFGDIKNKRRPYSLNGVTLQIKTSAYYRVWDASLVEYVSVGKGIIR